ncbi:MAG: acyl-CoA dehydrogenase family protein [Proteobacteria bacterium]|nr:acyl-CoA dehydrogenase family protein [Pseudomonadota bacterium]
MSENLDYFDETHRILRQTAARFVEREITPHVEKWEDAGEIPRELHRKASEAGILGVAYPEAYGGGGGDMFHGIVISEEVLRCGAGGVHASLMSHGIALPPILYLGTEEQKQRFVPPVLKGERIAALAVTEPDVGSDVANLRTRAVRDGDAYIVNGSKIMITSGCRADQVTVAVRTGGPGHPGVSILVVDTKTPGFTVANKLKKMGWWSSDTAELVFEDVRVPAENLIGAEGQGFYGIMMNFQTERLGLAVMANMTAKMAYDESLKYAKQRETFGKPISAHQVIRHKLVDMATMVEISREFTYRVAARMAAGQDTLKEVSMAKIFATHICDKVCFEAVQIHGGYGFMREYPVERLYRDSRVLSIGGGSTEIMKEIISKIILR